MLMGISWYKGRVRVGRMDGGDKCKGRSETGKNRGVNKEIDFRCRRYV